MDVDAAADRIYKVVEEYHVEANQTGGLTPEEETEVFKEVLKVIIEEIVRITISEVMECISQRKPTDMN
jgi:hypothetical protein